MAWTVPITIEGQTYPVRFDSENEPTQEDIADAANYIASQQSAPQEDTGQGRLSTFASGVARGVLSPVPGVIGGVGALTGSETLTDTAQSIEQGINETFPMNPAYQEEFWTGKASQAIGQGVSMLATGGVGGAIGKGLAAGRGISAAGQAAAATQAATRTMLGTGAAMGAREGQQEGERFGLTGANLYARIVAGAAIEPLTEKLPFGMLAETSAMKRIFGDAINARPVSSAGILATESVEEGTAQLGGDIATNIGATIEGTQGIGLGEMVGRAGESAALGAVGGAPIAGLNLLAGKQEPMTFGGTHARAADDTLIDIEGMQVAIPKGSPLTADQIKAMSPIEFAEAADKLQIKIPRPSSVVAAELTQLAATGQPVPIDPQAIRPQDTPAVAVAAQTNPETLAAVVAMTTNTTPVASPQNAPVAPPTPAPAVTPPEIVAGVEELSDAEALAIDAELGIKPLSAAIPPQQTPQQPNENDQIIQQNEGQGRGPGQIPPQGQGVLQQTQEEKIVPTPSPAVPTQATAIQPTQGAIRAVHFSREPLSIKNEITQESRDNVLGNGFYAMEPQDEGMWTNMDRWSPGKFRNEVIIDAKNPLVITPDSYLELSAEAERQRTERGYARAVIDTTILERMKSGGHDAVIIRGFDVNKIRALQEEVQGRINEEFTPKFEEGRTDGRFTNGAERNAIADRISQEVAGMPFQALSRLDEMQNQIFVPPENAPSVVSEVARQQYAQEWLREEAAKAQEEGVQDGDTVVTRNESGETIVGTVAATTGETTTISTTSGDVTVPTAGLVRQSPQSLSRKPGLAQALMESDGAALQLGISEQDVQRGIAATKRQIPGAQNIWSGTRQAFLDSFGNDPSVQDMVAQLQEGVMTEGFYVPWLQRGFILTDSVIVYQGDADRAAINGTAPAVEAAKRLIRHEVGGHGGWLNLTERQTQDFLNIARDVIPVSEMNQMIEDGYPFQDWQTDEETFRQAAEEWFSQRLGRLDRLPETGPMARFVEWLKGVWRWLTGRKGDPDLQAIKDLWRQIRMNQAAIATGRAWYSLPRTQSGPLYSRVRSNAEIAAAIRQQATLPNDPQTASEGKVIREDVAALFEPNDRRSIQQSPDHQFLGKNMGVDRGAAILDTLMQPERDPAKVAESTPQEIEQRGGDVELNLIAHEEAVRRALVLGEAISTSALTRYGISLPPDYRKFGELSAPVSPALIRATEFLTNQSLTEQAGIGMSTTLYPYIAYRLMSDLATAQTNARSNVERVALSQAMTRIYKATSGTNSASGQRLGATGIAQRYFGVTAGGVMALVENVNREVQGRIDASIPVDDLVAELNRNQTQMETEASDEAAAEIEADTEIDLAEADMLKQEGIAEGIIEEIANRLGDAPVVNDVQRKEREATIRDLHLRNVRQGMTEQDFIAEAATFEVFEGLASRLWNVGNMERQARATINGALKDIRLNEIAQERASQLIYGVEERLRQGQKDMTENAAKDTINKAFRDQVTKPVSFENFQARLRNLRVNDRNIERMFNTAERERIDLGKQALMQTRENLLTNESPHLAAVIRRIKDRIAPGISWRDLMVVDAQDGKQRARAIYQRVRQHEALRDLSPSEAAQLTRALNRNFIKAKEKVLRKELERVGATGTQTDPRVADLYEKIRRRELTAAEVETELQAIATPSRWKALRRELPTLLQDLAYGRVSIEQFKEKIGRGRKATDRAIQSVIDSTPKLIQAMNLGSFNAQAFRDAVSEKFGLRVITSEQARQIQQMVVDAQALQPGLPRDKAVQKIIDQIADYTQMSAAEIFNSFWVSSVLSGGRTQFDTWMNQLNAMRRVLQLAAWTSAKRINAGGLNIGWNAITRYFEVLPGMFQNALWYLWSGDSTLLLSEARETDRFLNDGQFSQSMDTKKAERLLSGAVSALGRGDFKQGILAFPAFFIVGVRRLMQAADYFSAAATLEASIPLAIALNPELAGKTRIPSREDYRNFRLRAREILTGGREPKGVREKAEERVMAQQLLMQSIDSLAIRDEIMEIGNEASYQNDPTGIGGIFYNSVLAVHQKMVASAEALRERGQSIQESDSPEILKKADAAARNFMYALAVGARALTGLQFARFAGNKTNELLGMTPLLGLARLAEKDKTRSQKAMIIMDNLVGTAIALGGIIYAMGLLDDDDDDERRGWRIEGGWDGLTADEKRQLRAAGKQPYSIGYLDRQDGTWKNYSYLQWATSGAFATIGNLRDRKRYRPELWNEDSYVGATLAAAAGNGQALLNMSMLQNLNDIFGGNSAFAARDPVSGMAGWLNRFASNYAGGFIPRAFKDADYMMDPRHTKANAGIELWLQHVPFYRRGVGEPYLDSLGYQVELRREPWSRAFVETRGTAAHNALASLVGKGMFISSLNMDNRVVRNGEDVRPMTDAEQKRMMDVYFPLLRSYLVREGPRIERMPMVDAKEKLSNDIQRLKSEAQGRAVR